MDELFGNNILLVTSNSLEKNAIAQILLESNVTLTKGLESVSSRVKIGVLNGYPITLLSAERGSFKADSVGVLLPEILSCLKPTLVMLIGFSYGRRGSVNLHDVVVSREVVSLVDFKATDIGITFRSLPRLISGVSSELITELLAKTNALVNARNGSKGLRSELRAGPIVSGEVLAEDETFVEKLFDGIPDVLGGDMEGQSVATHCCKRNIPWLILKSPSDYGGGTGGTTNAQTVAALFSAVAAIEFANAYIEIMKLSCPVELISRLNSEVKAPYERLTMNADKDRVRGTFKYASRIKKFIAKLALPQPYDQDFQDHLGGVVKEIAENASKHENATYVNMLGDSDAVIVEYEGGPFNPIEKFAKMKVSGGGKGEFDTFNVKYGGSAALIDIQWQYHLGKNQIRIKFSATKLDLRRNFSCSLSLDGTEMREYALYTDRNFSEFATCDIVWLNVEDTMMSLSDGMLLARLIYKIPKSVNQIVVRGCPKRLVTTYTDEFKYDSRVQFV